MQISEKKSFLLPFKTIEIQDSIALDKNIASHLDSFFSANENLFPFYRKRFDAKEVILLKDLRGRAPENFSNNDKHLPPKQIGDEQQLEELFYAEGFIREENEEDEDRTEDKFFSLSIYSQFESFDGNTHIVYRCLVDFKKELLEILEQPSLTCFLEDNPKLEITFARLGLEFFKASFIGSLVGSLPSVKTRLYLELGEGQIRVFAEDRVKKDEAIGQDLGSLLACLSEQVA